MNRWIVWIILGTITFLLNVAVCSELPELIATIRSDTTHSQFGLRIVPLGDQNNDGYDDFITSRFWKKSFLFYGGNPPDSVYSFVFDSTNGRLNNIGDVNNDGFSDFTVGKRLSALWKLNVFFGGDIIDTIPDIILGDDSLSAIGYSTFTDDINANGSPEIISLNLNQSGLVLFELTDPIDSTPDMKITPSNLEYMFDYDGFGESIISGDFNGDGRDDLAVNLRHNINDSLRGQVWLYWGGESFDTIPDMIITRPDEYKDGYNKFGVLLENLNDINGDGYDDFLAGSGISYEDTVNYIYFGGPDIDTIPDIILYESISVARLAGDLNSDGYNDIITSYPLSLSSIGHVNIYYGGDILDNIPDVTIYNSDMPEWQQYFGNDCSGVGDVNGDGIDDFAFSAVVSPWQGVIYLFSGTGPGTDVEYNYVSTFPEDFKLSHNFPNPFNPSTTINFEIPYKCGVSLRIYNILGKEVKILINKQLPAGSYDFEWNGTDNAGNQVSSGIYFYNLTSDYISLSKKMVLLK